MLKNSARAFLDAECPTSYVRDMELDERGYAPENVGRDGPARLAGLGNPRQSTAAKGLDSSNSPSCLRRWAARCLPGPYFSTVVMAGVAIAEAGSEAQKREYLPRIAPRPANRHPSRYRTRRIVGRAPDTDSRPAFRRRLRHRGNQSSTSQTPTSPTTR